MLDLKTELNALAIPFEELGWVKAPAYPYGIFTDEMSVRGADLPGAPRVITHNAIIEVYHADFDQLVKARDTLAAWADNHAFNYRLKTIYIVDENHFCVTLTTTFTEKEKKGMI